MTMVITAPARGSGARPDRAANLARRKELSFGQSGDICVRVRKAQPEARACAAVGDRGKDTRSGGAVDPDARLQRVQLSGYRGCPPNPESEHPLSLRIENGSGDRRHRSLHGEI